jgi:hypothetical protein
MNRYTYGILTFFITFGLSFSLVGLLFGFPQVNLETRHTFNPSARAKIISVIEQDMRNGDPRRLVERRIARKNVSNSTTKAEVMEAGQIYAAASSSIDVSGTPADFQYAWNRHMKAWRENSADINPTWLQVLRIARRYGVPIKRRYMQ